MSGNVWATAPRRADDTKVAGGRIERLVDGQREGGAAEFQGVEAEIEVVHDRITHHGELDDAIRIDLRLRRDFDDQRGDRLADRCRHLAVAARVQHGVGDAAHQVLAEPDLRVHHAGRGKVSAVVRSEMRRHRGRADIDGDAKDAIDKTRPDADDVATLP